MDAIQSANATGADSVSGIHLAYDRVSHFPTLGFSFCL